MKEILKIMSLISKPFKNGQGEKEATIINILKSKNPIYMEGIGIIVPAKKTRKIVVVSHIDLIKKFNKGFSVDKTFLLKKDENKIIGALDNTLTNAVLIETIKNLEKQGLDDNIEYLFTENEEIDLGGMKNYMILNKEFIKDIFFINLDVTYENWGHPASIEYDNPSFNICKQIKSKIKDQNITIDRDEDDLSAVLRNKGYGFSYCVPTKGNIHSYNNYANLDQIEKYKLNLEILLTAINFEEKEKDIFRENIRLIERFKTYKKYKKYINKQEKKQQKELIKRRKEWNKKKLKSTILSNKELNIFMSKIKDIPVKDGVIINNNKDYLDFENLPVHFYEIQTNGSAFNKQQNENGIDFDDLDSFNEEDRETQESEIYYEIKDMDEYLIREIENILLSEIDDEYTIQTLISFFVTKIDNEGLDNSFTEEDVYEEFLKRSLKDKDMKISLIYASYALKVLLKENLLDCDEGSFSLPLINRPFYEYF